MENFDFYSPTYFSFGKDAESKTGSLVKRFGGSKVLIHYGGGSVIRSGLLGRVKASLERESIGYIELGGVKPNPRSGLVYQGIFHCAEKRRLILFSQSEEEVRLILQKQSLPERFTTVTSGIFTKANR